jgi:putative transposase
MADYRRRLPHLHPDQAYLFLTWRLWGSPPPKVDGPSYATPGQTFAAQDRALDKQSGFLWLKDPSIAEMVARAILIGEVERHFYGLSAWVVMPNHVHLLILPKVPPAILMRWLKGSTARSANRILRRTGHRFWQDESYDHYLRSASQLGKAIAYIEQNPVSAGLVRAPEDWRWSSAGWQAEPPAPPNRLPG